MLVSALQGLRWQACCASGSTVTFLPRWACGPGSLFMLGNLDIRREGGYLIPGLLMGVLQIGWVAVIASVAVTFIMTGLGQTSRTLFAGIVVVWLYSLGWVAVRGIHHV